ncbi:MAG: hypothetical protein N3A54_03790 [Patescibacteria group bacterium]|nr:hypothetical protein [Patescibacteria group bacterium]
MKQINNFDFTQLSEKYEKFYDLVEPFYTQTKALDEEFREKEFDVQEAFALSDGDMKKFKSFCKEVLRSEVEEWDKYLLNIANIFKFDGVDDKITVDSIKEYYLRPYMIYKESKMDLRKKLKSEITVFQNKNQISKEVISIFKFLSKKEFQGVLPSEIRSELHEKLSIINMVVSAAATEKKEELIINRHPSWNPPPPPKLPE